MANIYIGNSKVEELYVGTKRVYAFDAVKDYLWEYLKSKITLSQEIFSSGSNNVFILNSNFKITDKNANNYYAPRIWTGCDENTMNNYNTFEIGIRFFITSATNQCLFTGNAYSSNYSGTPSIEPRSSSFGLGYAYEGESLGSWSEWNEIQCGSNLNVWRFVKLSFDKSTKLVKLQWTSNFQTFGSWSKTLTKNIRWARSLQFGGFNSSHSLGFIGWIDLKKTYVKKDGVLLWGCDLSDGYYLSHPNE